MKQLSMHTLYILLVSMSLSAQNHLHVVNSSGGELAKLESNTGFPHMVFSNDHGDIARIGLSQTQNTAAPNDDDLLIKGLTPFSKIRMEVGDGTGSGVITMNPTSNTNSAIIGALVGINSNSPSAPLTVSSVQGGVTTEFRTNESETFVIWTSDAGNIQRGYAGFFDDPNNVLLKTNFRIGTTSQNSNGALDFRTNDLNRMTIKNTGQVFIGDFSDFPATVVGAPESLNICGNVRTSGSFIANAFSCSSDLRFKKDITSIDNALQDVMNLNGVSYKWKTEKFTKRGFTEDKQIGLIAQEVEDVIPELVHTATDGYKSIDYQSLSAVLIEAIKEQQKTIEALEKRLTALEK